jgi:ABC-type nitrate/sulfonate/bicarbonate transport system substrate-binding protein
LPGDAEVTGTMTPKVSMLRSGRVNKPKPTRRADRPRRNDPGGAVLGGRRLIVLRFSDFGVRTYSLNLIVNDAAWASPEKRAIALKIVDAVQEGYSLVNERPADAAERLSELFPRLAPNYVDRSMADVSLQLNPPPIGGQTRAGWEETIKMLSSLGLLDKPVTVDDVAILDAN